MIWGKEGTRNAQRGDGGRQKRGNGAAKCFCFPSIKPGFIPPLLHSHLQGQPQTSSMIEAVSGLFQALWLHFVGKKWGEKTGMSDEEKDHMKKRSEENMVRTENAGVEKE